MVARARSTPTSGRAPKRFLSSSDRSRSIQPDASLKRSGIAGSSQSKKRKWKKNLGVRLGPLPGPKATNTLYHSTQDAGLALARDSSFGAAVVMWIHSDHQTSNWYKFRFHQIFTQKKTARRRFFFDRSWFRNCVLRQTRFACDHPMRGLRPDSGTWRGGMCVCSVHTLRQMHRP